MSQPRPLTDRAALLRNRARAERQGAVTFLHEEALFEVQERLIDVNRTFTSPAIVTGHAGFWSDAFPNAKVVPDDDTLALEGGAHDLVIHAMCLHWANDPVGQLVQSRRALKPDGLLLVAALGGQTLFELRAALSEAEVSLTGGLAPRVAPMGEIRDLGGLLQRAGLALPVADSAKRTVSYGSPLNLLRDLRAMGEGNALTDRQKTTPSRDLFARMERIYSDHHASGPDRVSATFEMIFLTGWAPSETQQKPLQPGSAKTRLADFLNTAELGPDAKPVKGNEDNER
ncbi:methyltransferase domain-containing protein [Litoreibacter arenae]|uniref:SAM-dependent methyltransferase n=1 Tax=Litoreibacter arenae DSM 19593 TaxID=1123360 RepID=S9RHU8_9RHOB|nr:methyltransferase domain-containing protein [Litoreibacter arenae]EPX77655.1 SAM-dependent methyltransferase [Litoreibacter arenae DSM 19593]